MQRCGPDYTLEAELARSGARRIVGVDEVGRGPLAGPVTAVAIWLDPACLPAGLRDSKRLSATTREKLCPLLLEAADIGIGHATPAEIDALNILQASLLAMERAIAGLKVTPDHLLIDGNRLPTRLPCPARAIIGGDDKVLSIAAASIVAKVTRDRIMTALERSYPGYGWDSNAGYPTKRHKIAIADLGLTPEHRRSFAPVRKMLCP